MPGLTDAQGGQFRGELIAIFSFYLKTYGPRNGHSSRRRLCRRTLFVLMTSIRRKPPDPSVSHPDLCGGTGCLSLAHGPGLLYCGLVVQCVDDVRRSQNVFVGAE